MVTVEDLDNCAKGDQTRLYMSFKLDKSPNVFEIYIMGNLNETCKYSDYNDYYADVRMKTSTDTDDSLIKEGTFGQCVEAVHRYIANDVILSKNLSEIYLCVGYGYVNSGKTFQAFTMNDPNLDGDFLEKWIISTCNLVKDYIQ